MPTPFGLLLHSSLDGLKQDGTSHASRPARHDAKLNGKRSTRMETRNELHELFPMRTGDLPHTLEAKVAERPAVRWTRYGYWNDGATAAYSPTTGAMIYDAKAHPTRPRR